MTAGIFGANKNMAGATPFGRGRYPVPGSFALELKALGIKASQDPKTRGHNILIAEMSVLSFEGMEYTSFLDGSKKNTFNAFKPGDTVSIVVDTDDPNYGLANSKELCAAIKMAVERQKNEKANYTLDDAMRELSNDEANAWVLDPAKNKELIGLAFKLEAWNVTRTNKGTNKPDDFTATKLQGA